MGDKYCFFVLCIYVVISLNQSLEEWVFPGLVRFTSSKPTQSSPFYMLESSSAISSSVWPWPFTIFQNLTNSSSEISPSPLKSTWSKNSFALSLPKLDFQCLSASSLSIFLLLSTSNILNVSRTFCCKASLSGYIFNNH